MKKGRAREREGGRWIKRESERNEERGIKRKREGVRERES